MSDTATTAAPAPETPAPEAPAAAPDTTAAAAPAKPAKAPAEAPKMVIIGGREYPEADLVAAIGRAGTVAQGLQQLASERKAFEEAQGQFKDPKKLRAYLKAQGVDPEQWAAETIAEAVQEEALTPEQRELAQLRAEKAERETAAKAAEEKKAKDEHEAKVKGTIKAYEDKYIAAMVDYGLPRTARTVEQLLDIVEAGIDAGLDVSQEAAAQILHAQLIESNRPLFKDMALPRLKEVLGDDVVKKIIEDHQSSLAAVAAKAPDAKAEKTTSGRASASRKERDAQKRWSEIFK